MCVNLVIAHGRATDLVRATIHLEALSEYGKKTVFSKHAIFGERYVLMCNKGVYVWQFSHENSLSRA
jgi:hypothetical protein